MLPRMIRTMALESKFILVKFLKYLQPFQICFKHINPWSTEAAALIFSYSGL